MVPLKSVCTPPFKINSAAMLIIVATNFNGLNVFFTADFGYGAQLGKGAGQDKRTSVVGTTYWMAPEGFYLDPREPQTVQH